MFLPFCFCLNSGVVLISFLEGGDGRGVIRITYINFLVPIWSLKWCFSYCSLIKVVSNTFRWHWKKHRFNYFWLALIDEIRSTRRLLIEYHHQDKNAGTLIWTFSSNNIKISQLRILCTLKRGFKWNLTSVGEFEAQMYNFYVWKFVLCWDNLPYSFLRISKSLYRYLR